MRTRRQFIGDVAGATAGVMFAVRGVRAARRQVTVGGRRVKVVDSHAHCAVPEVLDVVKGTDLERVVSGSLNGPLVMGSDRVRAMDDQGIDMQVLSINPYWYSGRCDWRDGSLMSRTRARRDVRGAAGPLRAVGHSGVAVSRSRGEQLEDASRGWGCTVSPPARASTARSSPTPKFDPFWAKVEQLGTLVFIHPQGVPELRSTSPGQRILTNVIGNPLDTTIALSHLIFEGTLDHSRV